VNTVPRDYLLLPSHPTPNGPLHLGHLAGPYLKIDALRRALDRRGGGVFLPFSLDSFDSYVMLRAHQLGLTDGEVVSRYAAEIRADLGALDIDFNAFLDPLQPPFAASYQTSVLNAVDAQRTCGALEEREERFLFSPRSQRFIVGAWLRGNCPRCKSECSGYSCEACAGHHRPEQLDDPHARVDEGPLEWRTVRTLFMHVLDEKRFLKCSAELLSPSDHALVAKHVKESGASLRVSVPGTWGVPITVDSTPQVVYPGFATLGLLRACGQEYTAATGKGDPFEQGSDVVLVYSFGIDNVVTRMLSCVGAALNAGVRVPDALLLNRFYRLEGQKFSTSRNHAIWASAVGQRARGFSDAVRFHLLATSPDDVETDFLAAEFRSTVAELIGDWNALLRTMASHPLDTSADETTIAAITAALSLQHTHLDPQAFRPRLLIDDLRAWVRRGQAGGDAAYWWLKGFALLAWPVVPQLSAAMWQFLGHSDAPCEIEWRDATTMGAREVPVFDILPVDVDAILQPPASPV
jgi:methionyl-tRNA synthetase